MMTERVTLRLIRPVHCVEVGGIIASLCIPTLVLRNEWFGDLVLHPYSVSAHTYPLKSRSECGNDLGLFLRLAVV